MRERGWPLAVRDMLDACERCLSYTSGMDQAAFLGDRRTYDATIRNIEIVGEAANNVPRPVQLQPYLFRVLQQHDAAAEVQLTILVSSAPGIPEDVLNGQIVEAFEQLGVLGSWDEA